MSPASVNVGTPLFAEMYPPTRTVTLLEQLRIRCNNGGVGEENKVLIYDLIFNRIYGIELNG